MKIICPMKQIIFRYFGKSEGFCEVSQRYEGKSEGFCEVSRRHEGESEDFAKFPENNTEV